MFSEHPNILFINIDPLRPDFMGCSNPRMDCTSPRCKPARYSMLSGVFPSIHAA